MGTAAIVWFVLAVVLGGAELATLTIALGLGAVGAAAAGVVALLGAGVPVQGGVFVAGTGLLVVGVRPVVRRHLLGPGAGARSGTDALIGTTARVTSPVGPAGGQVKVGGELWAARLTFPGFAEAGHPLPTGSSVVVTAVDGASVLVSPLEPLEGSS